MKIFFRQVFALAVCAVFFNACMSSTKIQVLQPAVFKVPDHINVVGVIDRSKPANGWVNVLEGVLTGESIGADREGRRRAVQGLTEALTRTPRFTVKSTNVEMTGSRSGSSMQPPLDWYEIERICKQYNVDGIIAIELFDSDENTTRDRQETKVKDKEGKETIKVSFLANRRINARVGWRFYDPEKKIIVDEAALSRDARSEGRGDDEKRAISNLPSGYRIIEDLGYASGVEYGARIAPTWISVSRNFFTNSKGNLNDEMKRAARYAESNEWMKAAEIWQTIAANKADKKAAGRATFNMAVDNEVLGKLDNALDWAQKAYHDFGVSEAQAYMDILKMRQNDARKVEHQMH